VLREDNGTAAGGDDDAPLVPQPASPDLAELVARFQAAGLPVTLTESGPPLPKDAGLQLAVYRIVQEALTNVLRHAPGSPRIDVTLERHPSIVVIDATTHLPIPAKGPPVPNRDGPPSMRRTFPGRSSPNYSPTSLMRTPPSRGRRRPRRSSPAVPGGWASARAKRSSSTTRATGSGRPDSGGTYVWRVSTTSACSTADCTPGGTPAIP